MFTSTLGRLPWRAAQRAGRAIGALGWTLSRRDRRRALDHLALAYPDTPEAERRRIARGCFRHFGEMLGECLHLFHRDCDFVRSVVEVQGWEEIEKVRREGRPLVIVTGHCGNWELLAAAINCAGVGMAVVARPLDEPRQQRLLAGLRERFGTPTIERGGEGAVRQLLNTLRRGGALGLLIDQDTKVEGVWVPFFGRPAFTPVGAAEDRHQAARGRGPRLHRAPARRQAPRPLPPSARPARRSARGDRPDDREDRGTDPPAPRAVGLDAQAVAAAAAS